MPTDLIIVGCNKLPPLAIAQYAKANCKFVQEISCPIAKDLFDW